MPADGCDAGYALIVPSCALRRSGDSTARIWEANPGPCGPDAQANCRDPIVLEHCNSKSKEKSKDVTTLGWNPEGTLLATGSYDGHVRVWSKAGERRPYMRSSV